MGQVPFLTSNCLFMELFNYKAEFRNNYLYSSCKLDVMLFSTCSNVMLIMRHQNAQARIRVQSFLSWHCGNRIQITFSQSDAFICNKTQLFEYKYAFNKVKIEYDQVLYQAR